MKKLAPVVAVLALVPAVLAGDLSAILEKDAKPTLVADGFQFTEGPAWSPQGFLLFSDIPADTIYKWTPSKAGAESAKPEVWRKPSNYSNGLTFDDKGRLLAAEHAGRVTRDEGGKTAIVADKFEGKPLSSPNDLVARSDGSVYFTDPTYGLAGALGPKPARKRQTEFNGVYRVAPDGSLSALVKDFGQPNGLAFSPDGKLLYVSDTAKGVVRVFEVKADGAVGEGREFASVKTDKGSAGPDGVRVDEHGDVLCAARGGVWVFDPKGEKLGIIEMPGGSASNLCFGGESGRTLFVTAGPAVYQVELKVKGAK